MREPDSTAREARTLSSSYWLDPCAATAWNGPHQRITVYLIEYLVLPLGAPLRAALSWSDANPCLAESAHHRVRGDTELLGEA